jgi:hypothetical protein
MEARKYHKKQNKLKKDVYTNRGPDLCGAERAVSRLSAALKIRNELTAKETGCGRLHLGSSAIGLLCFGGNRGRDIISEIGRASAPMTQKQPHLPVVASGAV